MDIHDSLTMHLNGLTAKNATDAPRSLSPILQQKTALIRAEWGDLTTFLRRFNPAVQLRVCGDAERCIMARVPALSEIRLAYGTEAPAMWLIPQIVDLSECCGCRGKLTENQLRQTAALIMADYFHLKVSEVMLYFFRFKGGHYGRFYGHVDPMTILEGFRAFMQYRARVIDRIEQARAVVEMERARAEAITYEEWQRRKKEREEGKLPAGE